MTDIATTDVAIRVENLGKKYKLGSQKSGSFRESMTHLFKRNGHAPISKSEAPEDNEFWALKDVSFEIKQGEAVGIIGRNGAGKSTLLKILSRITEPSKGRFEIFGRVSSLLEVGTGFHEELTGRENIYLNGTILGMRRAEVKAKFDEIVAFSGVEKFIDTPVKHYSSGMKVRLAFSVAAHLEPEILIIDEVLAVGDADFQRKCLGKMEDVTGQGRTVLFVSHQMNAIQKLCNSCMLVQQGQIEARSQDVNSIISKYYASGNKCLVTEWENTDLAKNNEYFIIEKFGLYFSNDENVTSSVSNNEDMWIKVEGQIDKYDPRIEIGYVIRNEENVTVYTSFYYDTHEGEWPRIKDGKFVLRSKFPKRLLNEGEYVVELIAGIRKREWFVAPGKFHVFFSFEVRGGLSDSPVWHTKRQGVIAPVIQWY